MAVSGCASFPEVKQHISVTGAAQSVDFDASVLGKQSPPFYERGALRLGCHFPEGTDALRGCHLLLMAVAYISTHPGLSASYLRQYVHSRGKPYSKLHSLEKSQANNGHNPKSGSCLWVRPVSWRLRSRCRVGVLWRKQGRQWG